MFSIFPDGLPGAGLAILRMALGGVLALRVLLFLRDRHDWNPLMIAVALLMVVSALLVAAGYRTRWAAMLAAVAIAGAMASFNGLPQVEMLDIRTTEVFAIAIAVAVACMGPGAFSLDSRLFGRREIVIPKSCHKD
jgi:uncharacterized membrane protein YphA (DoxX/SURF4 family)